MATVTYHVRSYYNPDDREKLEKETGQETYLENGLDPDEAWVLEASKIERRRPPPPRFVPATVNDDQWAFGIPSSSKIPESSTKPLGHTISGWYRSMTYTPPGVPSTFIDKIDSTSKAQQHNLERPRKTKESRNKNNWFIMNAIQSESLTTTSTPAPSLADILARDPPPLPLDGKFAPPVFLEIGPSNKGFGMLQRSGWSEGEPLGPDVIRRNTRDDLLDGDIISLQSFKSKRKGESRQSATNVPSRRESVEVKLEKFDDVSELWSVDVIDLTLSDSESEDEPGGDIVEEVLHPRADVPQKSNSRSEDRLTSANVSLYAQKALVTPISTVLKSDRLGIGLKAKTVGPYKSSQKRITHNAAALAAHTKAAEESRKRKAKFGRGLRGFERQKKREEESRQALLAQLK